MPRRRVAFLQRDDFLRPLLQAPALAAGGGEDALGELVVGRVLLQAGANPGLEPRGLVLLGQAVGIDAEVAGLEQVAELQRPQGGVARLARAARRSSASRLSGSASARNSRTSSGVGNSPVTSSRTRRRNVASSARPPAECSAAAAWPGRARR